MKDGVEGFRNVNLTTDKQWRKTGVHVPLGGTKQGLRVTTICRDTCSEHLLPGIYTLKNFKCIVNCCECSKLYWRPSLEPPSVQSFL